MTLSTGRSLWARQLSIGAALAIQGSLALQFSPLETIQFTQVYTVHNLGLICRLGHQDSACIQSKQIQRTLRCPVGLILGRPARHYQAVSRAKPTGDQHGSDTHKGGLPQSLHTQIWHAVYQLSSSLSTRVACRRAVSPS